MTKQTKTNGVGVSFVAEVARHLDSGREAHGSARASVQRNGLDFMYDAVNLLCAEPTSRRTLMYATIHLCTAIELLLKTWVMREHWAFAFEDLDLANSARLSSGDLQSATQDQCIKRLDAIGQPLSKSEQDVLKRLRKMRNQMVHFFADRLTEDEIRSVLVECLSGLMNTIEQRCDASLVSLEDTSLPEIRRTLQTLVPYVIERRRTIATRVSALGEDAFHCPSCGERAVDLDEGDNRCLLCLDMFHDSEILDVHQKRVLGIGDGTRNVDHGFCPDCGSGSAGRRWSDNDRIFCFGCGMTFEPGQLSDCNTCGEWQRNDQLCKNCAPLA